MKSFLFLSIFSFLMFIACSEEEKVVPVPTVSVTVESYTLPKENVVSNGQDVLIRLPSFNDEWKPTDLTKLKVTFGVKDGVLKNYENGVADDFSKTVNIDIMNYLYDVSLYAVRVETYTPAAPEFKITGVSIDNITLDENNIIITDNSILLKVPTLTDNFTATDYAKLSVKYDLVAGKARGFENGAALNYSLESGIDLQFERIDGVVNTFNVKVEPVYIDKGAYIDPVLSFMPLELNWKKVTNESLVGGLELYSVSDLKPGSTTDKVSGYYAKLDLSAASQAQLAVGYTSGAVQNIKKWYTDAPSTDKPIIVTNGGFFGGGTSYSLLIDNSVIKFPNIGVMNRTFNGVATPYPATRSALGIMPDGSIDITWVYNSGGKTYSFDTPVRNDMRAAPLPSPMHAAFASIRKEWNPVFAIGGAPILVKNGNVVCTQNAEISDQFAGNRARTAVGVTEDNKLILLVLDEAPVPVKGFSLQDLSMIMKTLGCKDAMNLDGGGSSAMLVNGVIKTNSSDKSSEGDSRAISTSLMIKKKL